MTGERVEGTLGGAVLQLPEEMKGVGGRPIEDVEETMRATTGVTNPNTQGHLVEIHPEGVVTPVEDPPEMVEALGGTPPEMVEALGGTPPEAVVTQGEMEAMVEVDVDLLVLITQGAGVDLLVLNLQEADPEDHLMTI